MAQMSTLTNMVTRPPGDFRLSAECVAAGFAEHPEQAHVGPLTQQLPAQGTRASVMAQPADPVAELSRAPTWLLTDREDGSTVPTACGRFHGWTWCRIRFNPRVPILFFSHLAPIGDGRPLVYRDAGRPPVASRDQDM